MAHFVRVVKAISLKTRWLKLIEEKQQGLNPELTKNEEPVEEDFGTRFQRKLKESALGRHYYRVKSENTFESFVWKSLLGFLGGVLLTYLFFFFFYIGMNITLRNVTYICGISGILLCLGMAFSSKVRCYVFLLLPVFFSKQGRQALIAYALFLAFTGPGKNTMHNMGILSESMTCGQQVIKRTLRQLIDMVKAPLKSIKETIDKITETIKNVVEIIREFVMKITRIIVSILNVIKKVTTWLGSIVNFCNKKVGTPFQRCMKTFDDAITDCKAKLGILDFMCHVVHVVKALCYTVKWLDFICLFTDFVSEQIVGKVRKKLREFTLHMKNLFYVSVEFSHSYEFETSASNSTKEVAKTILQKISEKVEKLQTVFGFFGFLFGFLFLFVFFKVYYYKYKYLSSDRYDNYYISNYIIELDLKRSEMDRETVLPLELRERRKYGRPTAVRLLKAEKSRMAESVFLLTLTSFKIVSFLVCDYSLFWVLNTIYEAGKDEVDEIERPKVGIHVKGRGVIAKFYENLGKTFQVPDNPYAHPNPLHCLPDPVEPDTGRYIQIGFLLALSWLLALLEPYGLRLRNIVMSHYYPQRAKERAVWLYNHILRTRGSFIKFARRQLRRKFLSGNEPVERVSFIQRLSASFPIFGILFGKANENACIMCGAVETEEEPLKRCKTPECKGRYCMQCYTTIQNICTLCQHPIEYGDISDISEEVDSSEEDFIRSQETTVTSEPSEDKYETFEDLEHRKSFKDVEANKRIDYAKVDDLQREKEEVQRRIKSLIMHRLNSIAAERKQETHKKVEEIKVKLAEKIEKLKEKKNENHQALKSALRKNLRARSDLGPLKPESEENLMEDESPKPSKVSFQLNPEVKVFENERPDTKEELVNEIKSKIQHLLNTKSLKSQSQIGDSAREDVSEREENITGSGSQPYQNIHPPKDEIARRLQRSQEKIQQPQQEVSHFKPSREEKMQEPEQQVTHFEQPQEEKLREPQRQVAPFRTPQEEIMQESQRQPSHFKPSQEEKFREPQRQPSHFKPSQEEKFREPQRQPSHSKPSQEEKFREPQRQPSHSKPSQEEKFREPQRQPSHSKPSQEEKFREPQRQPSHSKPSQEDKFREPQRQVAPFRPPQEEKMQESQRQPSHSKPSQEEKFRESRQVAPFRPPQEEKMQESQQPSHFKPSQEENFRESQRQPTHSKPSQEDKFREPQRQVAPFRAQQEEKMQESQRQPSHFKPSQEEKFREPQRQPSYFEPSQEEKFREPQRQPTYFKPSQEEKFREPQRQVAPFRPPQEEKMQEPQRQPSQFEPSQEEKFQAPQRQVAPFRPPQEEKMQEPRQSSQFKPSQEEKFPEPQRQAAPFRPPQEEKMQDPQQQPSYFKPSQEEKTQQPQRQITSFRQPQEEEIIKAQEEEIQKSQQQIQKSQQQIQKSQEEILKLQEQIQKSQQQIQKSQEKIQKSQQEIKKSNDEFQQSDNELTSPNKENVPKTLTYFFVEKEKRVSFRSPQFHKVSNIRFEGPRKRILGDKKYYF